MTPLGWFHFIAALTAIAAGAAIFFRRKGNRRHRQIGWAYVSSMVALNVSALMIYRLTGRFGPFHAAAIVSLASVVAGVLTIRRRRADRARGGVWVERHYHWMSWSYVGLLAAAVSESATRFAPGVFFWQAVLAATVVVVVLGGMLVTRGAGRALQAYR